MEWLNSAFSRFDATLVGLNSLWCNQKFSLLLLLRIFKCFLIAHSDVLHFYGDLWSLSVFFIAK